MDMRPERHEVAAEVPSSVDDCRATRSRFAARAPGWMAWWYEEAVTAVAAARARRSGDASIL